MPNVAEYKLYFGFHIGVQSFHSISFWKPLLFNQNFAFSHFLLHFDFLASWNFAFLLFVSLASFSGATPFSSDNHISGESFLFSPLFISDRIDWIRNLALGFQHFFFFLEFLLFL